MFKTILSTILSISNFLGTFFSYKLFKATAEREDNKETKEKIRIAKEEISKACDKGTISDLLNATKNLGDANK